MVDEMGDCECDHCGGQEWETVVTEWREAHGLAGLRACELAVMQASWEAAVGRGRELAMTFCMTDGRDWLSGAE